MNSSASSSFFFCYLALVLFIPSVYRVKFDFFCKNTLKYPKKKNLITWLNKCIHVCKCFMWNTSQKIPSVESVKTWSRNTVIFLNGILVYGLFLACLDTLVMSLNFNDRHLSIPRVAFFRVSLWLSIRNIYLLFMGIYVYILKISCSFMY